MSPVCDKFVQIVYIILVTIKNLQVTWLLWGLEGWHYLWGHGGLHRRCVRNLRSDQSPTKSLQHHAEGIPAWVSHGMFPRGELNSYSRSSLTFLDFFLTSSDVFFLCGFYNCCIPTLHSIQETLSYCYSCKLPVFVHSSKSPLIYTVVLGLLLCLYIHTCNVL